MRKFFLSVLLVLGGVAIFVLGIPYYSIFPTNGNQTYALALTAFFLITSLALKWSRSLSHYWPAAYALFIASAGLPFLSTGVLNLQRDTMEPMQSLAMDKLSQFLHVVPIIVGLTLLARGDLRSIFIGPGRLKQGLTFGLVSFAAFGVLSVVTQWNSA